MIAGAGRGTANRQMKEDDMGHRNRSSQYGDDNRYGNDRWGSDREQYRSSGRQSEQFSRQGGNDDDYGYRSQEGSSYRGQDRYGSGGSYQSQSRDDRSYGQSGSYGSNYSDDDDYSSYGGSSRYSGQSRGYGRYANYGRDTDHRSFRGDDYGGQDYSRGGYGGSTGGSYGSGYNPYSSGSFNRQGYGDQDRDGYGNDSDRGFLAKAGDQIASWFGGDDEDDRQGGRGHSGKGPSNYTRSNERLLEDACERLTRDRYVNASNITVTADNNEITLDGTVDSRQAKRRAEDVVHNISGVKHVQNNLRVDDSRSSYSSSSQANYSSGSSTGSSTSDTTTS